MSSSTQPPIDGQTKQPDAVELQEKGEMSGQQPADAPSEDHAYPSAGRLAVILVGIYLAFFLVALDSTIIATAIPRITDEFNSLDDIGWYGSAYLLTGCTFQLMFGKLYTLFSVKGVFLVAFALFELGSLICATAPNSVAFIFGRAIAGLGSAGIMNGLFIILADCVPLRRRPAFAGIGGALRGVASVIGPILGGTFTDRITWRWCFYINLPIGALTFVVVIFFLQLPGPQTKRASNWKDTFLNMDPIGTALFVPAIVCLLLALQWGGSVYAWSNARIIVLLVLFVLLTIGFIAVQVVDGRKLSTTIPTQLITQRTIAAGTWYIFCVGSGFFLLVYYLPVWFQAIQDDSAQTSGIHQLPLILGTVVISIVAGIGVTIIGYYVPFMILSSILLSVGSGLLTTLKVNTSSPVWIGYQVLAGCGVGFGMQQPVIAAQTVLPRNLMAMGTSLIMFAMTLGGAIFISAGQSVFTNALVRNLSSTVPNISAQMIVSSGATELHNLVPQQYLPAVLVAYNDAITAAFKVSLVLACLSAPAALCMEWRSVKKSKPDGNGGAQDSGGERA
ncbi:MFS general substrate transporter [Calocera viscosa TUFC12733]|uniref:MFS general substrate transporter n=1 Tax=Calocera viscosa (strain TUFC12733) TaxID=1330018 RepID=A0A167RBM4_CALVF|nr:MFS general substrate transporter [Calocera viscosa TUFC12733]